MTADDENPKARWQSVSDWYAESSRDPGWEFVEPMADLTAWVAEQSWAATLFANTSHERLCVKLKPDHDPKTPFFSCGVLRSDGQFECDLWAAGRRLERRCFPMEESRTAFWNFVRRLEGVT